MARRTRNAAGEQTEAAFQSAVVGLARMYGWRIYHAPDNRPAGTTGRPQSTGTPEGRGFPDLVLVKGPRLVFAELKSRTGRIGPGQTEWLEALVEVGAAVERCTGRARAIAARTENGDRYRRDIASVEAYLWRPADWPDVQNVLGAGENYRCDLDPLNTPA